MSWKAAGKLARQIADRYDGVSTVSPERLASLKDKLYTLDREALVEWLHRRIAMEFRAFSATCNLNFRADEEVTLPDIPSKRPPPTKP